MKNRNKILICILLLGVGYAAAWFTKPESVKEVVKYKQGKDVTIIKTKYVYADGSTKEQEIIKDKTETTVDSETVTLNRKLGVRAALLRSLDSKPAYQLELQSPPLIKIFSSQLGIAAALTSTEGRVDSYVGAYVQF